jgi:hypothetical protein
MMKPVTVITLFALVLFGGCAMTPMYYWDGYSNSLYRMKKNPDVKNVEKHKKTLESIIENSNKKKLRVPPGIYCEYGYMLLQEGNTQDAAKYIDLEEKTYPESKVFIQRIKSKMLGGVKNETPAESTPVNTPATK